MQTTPMPVWRLVLVALVLAMTIACVAWLIVRIRAKKRVRGFPVEPRE